MTRLRAKCKHRYVPPDSDDAAGQLAIERGEELVVHYQHESGWAEGVRVRDGACGWFPGNFVRVLAEEEAVESRGGGGADSDGGGAAAIVIAGADGVDAARADSRAPPSPTAAAASATARGTGDGEQDGQLVEILRARVRALGNEHDELLRRIESLETQLEQSKQRANRRAFEMAQALTEEMQRREVAEWRLREMRSVLHERHETGRHGAASDTGIVRDIGEKGERRALAAESAEEEEEEEERDRNGARVRSPPPLAPPPLPVPANEREDAAWTVEADDDDDEEEEGKGAFRMERSASVRGASNRMLTVKERQRLLMERLARR